MKVGVIVPRVQIQGGVERALLAIVTYLVVGSRQHMTPCEVVIGLNGSDAHLEGALRALRLPGVSLRRIRLAACSNSDAVELMTTAGKSLRVDIPSGPWCLVRDEVCDFLDADVWIQISTRTRADEQIAPVVPLRPLVVFPFDLLEVRGGAGFDDAEVMSSLRVIRAADNVAVSTDATFGDVIAFGGVPRSRMKKLPIEFHGVAAVDSPRLRHHEAAWGPYALWVTNGAPHKNHALTLDALRLAKQDCQDLRCIVVGFGSEIVIADLGDEYSPWVSAMGYVSDDELEALLSSARFLLHSAIGDNGSFTPLQAACSGTITVCADYPAMREVANERFLECLWFDPTDARHLSERLTLAWSEPHAYRDVLSRYRMLDVEQAASEWFQQWSKAAPVLPHA